MDTGSSFFPHPSDYLGEAARALKAPRDPSLSLIAHDLPAGRQSSFLLTWNPGLRGCGVSHLWSLEAAAGLTCQQGSKRLCDGMLTQESGGSTGCPGPAAAEPGGQAGSPVKPDFPASGLGRAGAQGQGRAGPAPGRRGRSTGGSLPLLEAQHPGSATQTLGAAQANQRWGRGAALM